MGVRTEFHNGSILIRSNPKTFWEIFSRSPCFPNEWKHPRAFTICVVACLRFNSFIQMEVLFRRAAVAERKTLKVKLIQTQTINKARSEAVLSVWIGRPNNN